MCLRAGPGEGETVSAEGALRLGKAWSRTSFVAIVAVNLCKMSTWYMEIIPLLST